MISLKTSTKHLKAPDMLTLGLVNNMPAAAIHSTERHFRDVLKLAAQDTPFEIRWFRFAGARPSNYERLEDLWDSHLDGLIVTGAEPKAERLQDEQYWPALTRTIEWAAEHTSSAIWSCLAAHAAVFHLDGVERRPRGEKIFGIFDSVKAADHALVADFQPLWSVPHSRWNDLLEADLLSHGYNVLATSKDAGVDTFVKQVASSLFVFIQSHPEYDIGALMREYRRDVARFHSGQQERYPTLPRNYFDSATAAGLEAFGSNSSFPAASVDLLERAELPNGWTPLAVQLYRNWLLYLSQATS
jgi:homoserine O-succinyltransferase